MPLHNNEYLDDPMVFDRQRSCTKGMVSSIRAHLISEDAASQLWDVDSDDGVTTNTRRAWRKFGDLKTAIGSGGPQGVWWFDWKPYQFLLVCAGGNLYRGDSAGTWTLVASNVAADDAENVFGVQCGQRFYLSSGDGRAMFWLAADIAGSDPGQSVIDGPSKMSVMTAVRHQVFGLDADSNDSVHASTTLSDTTRIFSIGSSPILPFRIGDGGGDPILSMLPWRGLSAFVAIKAGSVWMIDTSTVASVPDAAIMTGAFGVQQVGWTGTSASRSCVVAGNDVLFLAEDGIRSLAKTIEDGEGEVSEPISTPIDDLVRRINPTYRPKACAAYHNGRAMFAVPLDNATTPNCVFVFNQKLGSWVVWSGIQPVGMVVGKFTGKPKQCFALDSRGHLLEWRDWVVDPVTTDYRDNVTGSDVRIPWRIRSRAMSFSDSFSPKAGDGVEFEWHKSEALVDIDVILDDDTSGRKLVEGFRTGYPGWILAPDGGTAGEYPSSTLDCRLAESKVLRESWSLTNYPNFREVSFEMREAATLSSSEESEAGAVRFRGIQATGFLETMEEQS